MNKSLKNEIEIIENYPFFDFRGSFLKIANNELGGIQIDEVFYSVSEKNVIRGFHLQKNPNQIKKIVTCVKGEIVDVCIDIRKNSKNFGKIYEYTLNSENNKSLFIPYGFAHAFLSNSSETIVLYLQSGEHVQSSEIGFNPLSAGFDWGVKNPIISDRDLSLPAYKNFKENINL